MQTSQLVASLRSEELRYRIFFLRTRVLHRQDFSRRFSTSRVIHKGLLRLPLGVAMSATVPGITNVSYLFTRERGYRNYSRTSSAIFVTMTACYLVRVFTNSYRGGRELFFRNLFVFFVRTSRHFRDYEDYRFATTFSTRTIGGDRR